MATVKVNFSEIQALYELCSSGVDIKEFCAQQGVSYPLFQSWQRKQLWNEKTGKREEVAPSTLNAVKITGLPVADRAVQQEVLTHKSNVPVNPIRYIQVKLPEGVTITRTNASTQEIIALLTKLTSALC